MSGRHADVVRVGSGLLTLRPATPSRVLQAAPPEGPLEVLGALSLVAARDLTGVYRIVIFSFAFQVALRLREF